MKKFFSLVLALVMALSLTAVAWGATTVVNDETELKAALAAGGKVVLGDDITLTHTDNSNWAVVGYGKTVILDLAGHTITRTIDDSYGAIRVLGELTINDTVGSGGITDANYAIVVGWKGFVGDGAKLTINGGTFTGSGYAISGNGTVPSGSNTTNWGTEITINGGTITGTDLGIYHPQKGDLYINGGAISGASGVELRAGTLTITGGDISATAPAANFGPNSNGATSSGVAVAVAQHTTKQAINVTITGGDLRGAKAFAEANPQANTTPAVTIGITGGDFNGDVTVTDGQSTAISGGTFTNDVSAYVPAGYTLSGGVVATTSTDKYDLHKADAAGTKQLTGFSMTPMAAVKNADGTGTIAYFAASNGVKYIEIPAAQAKVTDYYVTAVASTVPVKYLREVTVVDYTYTVAAFTNLGTACGQVNNTLTPTADYYTVTVGTAKDTVYMEGTTGAYALAGNEIVQLNATPATKNAHTWVASGMTKGVVTSAVCAKCGAPAAVYTSISKIPAGSAYVTLTTALGANGEIYVVPAGAAVVPSTPSTDKVESAETFDAGIAMYVGMSVMAAAGSAVVLKKRED